MTKTDYIEKFIKSLLFQGIESKAELFRFQRRFAKEHELPFFSNDEILDAYQHLLAEKEIKESKIIGTLFRLKNTRSESGIVVVSVLTKPYDCPGKCIYCPSEKNIPKSYLEKEPAVMRAIMCKYHPFAQVSTRLKALRLTGHITDKVSIRIIGGTWSYYPKNYQTWFIKELFRACNDAKKITKNHIDNESLEALQEINQTSDNRIVELSVETRQDYINEKEIKRLRQLGVTKVELGVQSIFDEVLDFCKRGNKNEATIQATKLLKDAGFKVSYQMMLNLPKSDTKNDILMFEELFNNNFYRPDHLKIYPLALLRNTELYDYYERGQFKPYTETELVKTIARIKEYIPYSCRVERVIRDIPTEYIVQGGAKVSNLRQTVLKEMQKTGRKCKCIRCREIKSHRLEKSEIKMFREDFEAAGGKEVFLTFESKDRKYLISIIRLRLPSYVIENKRHFVKALNGSAIIREIHTYGNATLVGKRQDDSFQHLGYGKKLVKEAERITKSEFNLDKIAVIAGVGVREYFEKLGYELEETYMTKVL